jgi:glycosyltransferase involved in cell wall biosynthesis
MLGYRITDRLADLSTNVSNEAVEAFVSKGAVAKGRMIPVYNGIDTTIFGPDPQAHREVRESLTLGADEILLLAVGRLWKQKDYPNLLRALADLNTEHCPRLFIVGDGPLRAELAELVSSLNLRDYVQFLGIRHDIPALMAACDVFVLSSEFEGFGLVVAEAMACEKLVVATDCGGVREVVGDAGLLVPPRDTEALVLALKRALSMSPGERASHGREGRLRVEQRYSLENTASRYLAIYAGQEDNMH